MDANDAEVFKRAFELYRHVAADVLPRLKGPLPLDVEEFVEELKEALLDLKQATIDLDPARATYHIQEVLVLLRDLDDKMKG